MSLAIGLILAIVSVVVVASPFFLSRRRRRAGNAGQSLEEVMAKRERIYEEMRTLQVDFQLGNIDEDEYESLMRTHRLEAAALVQQQESLEQEARHRALEDEIRAFRRGRKNR